MALFTAIADILFPLHCAGCGVRGAWFCARCRPRMSPRTVVRTDARVQLIQDPATHASVAALYALKYEGYTVAVRPLGTLLASGIAALCGTSMNVALVPVPTSRARIRSRGYDHAVLLADAVGSALGIPVLHLLERARATERQVGLGREARLANVAGAFHATSPPPGIRLYVLDDVCTTGATFAAAMDALRAAGADRLTAVALFGSTDGGIR